MAKSPTYSVSVPTEVQLSFSEMGVQLTGAKIAEMVNCIERFYHWNKRYPDATPEAVAAIAQMLFLDKD